MGESESNKTRSGRKKNSKNKMRQERGTLKQTKNEQKRRKKK